MAFKTSKPAAKSANPAVIALEAQKARMMKDIDRQLQSARRTAQAASAELSRARHAVTIDALIASAAAEGK